MKKISNIFKTLILFSGLILFSNSALAQSDLYGKWKAICVIESLDDGSSNVCSICPTKLLSGSKLIEDFEMEINSEVIKFITEGRGSESPYKYEAAKNLLSFTYNKIDYKFKVLMQTDPFINIFKLVYIHILILHYYQSKY